MSRWAQWGAVTNSLRNAAAVQAPPELERKSAKSNAGRLSQKTDYSATQMDLAQAERELWCVVVVRYVPAVLADVVEISQLAVSHLFGVVLEKRHPPHSVTCCNTSLRTQIQKSCVNRGAESVTLVRNNQVLYWYLVQLLKEPVRICKHSCCCWAKSYIHRTLEREEATFWLLVIIS